jgi:hypothetical protein
LIYLSLFKLVGPRVWIPSAMLIALGLSLAWLSVQVSKRVINGWAALLPALLFLTFAFRLRDGTHHWYSAVAVRAAIAVVIEKRTLARLLFT